ncbi:MAG: rod shape-determining protein RodA [Eggerthellaceae bacterium]|jgi:rod shape determining protein RodA|nr:rod shape-determining protein RodA [Eggerthellaceae bacterium]
MPQMMNEISSVRPQDPSVAKALKPRRFKYINPPFVFFIVALVAYGLLVQFSATSSDPDYSFTRQLMGVGVGMVLFAVISRVDYHVLSGYTTVFLIVNVVLLLSPHIPGIGVEVNGGQSWINVGIQLQPGEFAKVTVVLLAASVMARYGGRLNDLREYIKALLIMAVPFVCVMTQPDLGTGLVYLMIAGFALIIGGANWRFIVATIGVLVIMIAAILLLDPVLDQIAGSDVLLKDYQMSRLTVFLDPTHDTSGDGYNLQQAMIAIGSGGFFGKGFMQATQSSLGFLPEAPTDFVFCVLAEEFGFVGALVLIAFYIGLVFCSIVVARNSGDLFGTIIVVCVVGMWLFQILENIGMTCGLMPITGIPLPFISYGSSFMIVNFMMLGLINSVWVHNGR